MPCILHVIKASSSVEMSLMSYFISIKFLDFQCLSLLATTHSRCDVVQTPEKRSHPFCSANCSHVLSVLALAGRPLSRPRPPTVPVYEPIAPQLRSTAPLQRPGSGANLRAGKYSSPGQRPSSSNESDRSSPASPSRFEFASPAPRPISGVAAHQAASSQVMGSPVVMHVPAQKTAPAAASAVTHSAQAASLQRTSVGAGGRPASATPSQQQRQQSPEPMHHAASRSAWQQQQQQAAAAGAASNGANGRRVSSSTNVSVLSSDSILSNGSGPSPQTSSQQVQVRLGAPSVAGMAGGCCMDGQHSAIVHAFNIVFA